MPRTPRRSRRLSMSYSALYGRRLPELKRSKYCYNVCVTLLQGVLRVYEFYKEQSGQVTAEAYMSMTDIEFLFLDAMQSRDKTVLVEKPLVLSVNNFLSIMCQHFSDRGMFEVASDVQLVYLTEFIY